MISAQIIFTDVAPVLLESGFLALRDYVYLQSAQKKSMDWYESSWVLHHIAMNKLCACACVNFIIFSIL
jgi:hypothetical protein